ncbi:hypothetical protein [Wenyingzhuangia sp. IMCC45574]
MSNQIVTEIDFSNLSPNDLVKVNADKTGFDSVLLSENLQIKEIDGACVLDTSIREHQKNIQWKSGDSKVILLPQKVSYLKMVFVNGVKLTEGVDFSFSGVNVIEITKTLNDNDAVSIHYQHNLNKTLADVPAPAVSKISIQSFK